MGSERFYRHLLEGKFTITDYPVAGANIILPWGEAVLSKLEDALLQPFHDRGYQKLSLPQAVPPSFLKHLKIPNLFTVTNGAHDFLLAPASEMQAALAAKALVQSYRDLPLRLYSTYVSHRQETRRPLIKDQEYRTQEFHAFFTSSNELEEEANWSIESTQQIFTNMGIQTVAIDKATPERHNRFLYAWFPHFEAFGSIFCASTLGSAFTQAANVQFTTPNGKFHPGHANLSFTSRILPAYLANHLDERGFVLDPAFSPVDALVHNGKESIDEITDQLTHAGLKFNVVKTSNREQAKKEFLSKGSPLFISATQGGVYVIGRHESENYGTWCKSDNIIDSVLKHFPTIKQEAPMATQIEICRASNIDEPCCNAVYSSEYDEGARAGKLLRLGSLSNGRIAYVKKIF